MDALRARWLVPTLALLAAGGPAVLAADAESTAPPAVTTTVTEEAAAGERDSPTGRRYQIRYRLDTRAMGSSEGPTTLDVMAAEAEITGEIGQHLEYAVQIPLYTSMEGRGRDMHFGNLYAIYRRKLGEPTVKLGQFVIPFGNLPDYETHTRPVQTLYRYSVGVRIDPGVEVEGFLGRETTFQVALTTGNGAFRSDNNGNKVLTARLSRTLTVGADELRLGLSALAGVLPVFSLMSDPVMGTAQVLEFSHKQRVALDAEYSRGPLLLRAEVVAGDDDGRGAYGHWLQVSYPLSYQTSLEAGTERWSQFSGALTGYWAGVEHKLNDRQTLRLVLQQSRAREGGMRMDETMVTAQLLVEF